MLGKSLAGGIPVAVWGCSRGMAERIWSVLPHFRPGDAINHFGFGGTLAGSALQMAAAFDLPAPLEPLAVATLRGPGARAARR